MATGEPDTEETIDWRHALLSREAWWGYLVVALGGIAAGLGALYFAGVEIFTVELLRDWHNEEPWLAFLVMPGFLILIIWLRDHYFCGTDGTGIPQTIAALKLRDGPARDVVLSMRIALGKLILTTLGLCAFLSIGREGPSVQLGACFMRCCNRFAKFPAHLVQRGLILAGGAAGIAAAFNAPIAGVVFALEEIGRRFDKENMGTLVRTVILACMVCVLFLGNYYFYGELDYGRDPLVFDSFTQWLLIPIIAVIGGLLGGLFSKTLLICMPYVNRAIKKNFVLTAGAIGLACAALAFFTHGGTLGSGYVEARSLLLQGSPDFLATIPVDQQDRLMEAGERVTPFYFLWRAIASFLVLLTAIPGGLFDPSFSVGAGLGHTLFPMLEWTGAPMQAVLLLFIVSYFSGVVQSPMTSFIILLEMTGVTMFALPLALTAMLAYEVSRLVCPTALYEALAFNFLRASSCAAETPETSEKKPT
ncbi:chloride channel protein [Cerasicoccus arenae]|uniref:Chloride channel protein n=1 Tax=Cerasicoccus arenae TaxID=424488 RepID=A0A8J3GDZ0_9BACT|nr:chloride channel protein [Cerasicoccus arenae]MBK1857592.1 chloride channel protein [Cerasicoccus arenae]GHC05708.1 chloride channel protein [Cerasicoccus arenae]